MKVIERYIFRRTLLLFCAALAWTMSIVWTTQILTRIDLVTDNGQSALAFFEIAALILPSVMPVVFPFATIVAVAQTLNAMNTDSELVVISAAGASPMTRQPLDAPVQLRVSHLAIAVDHGRAIGKAPADPPGPGGGAKARCVHRQRSRTGKRTVQSATQTSSSPLRMTTSISTRPSPSGPRQTRVTRPSPWITSSG